MERNEILLWNDDNHDPCVWINREFMGVDFGTVLENALFATPKNTKKIVIKEVFPWDFQDDCEDLEDSESDIIFDWFQGIPDISSDQWRYIFNSDWKRLGKTL